MIQLLKRVHFCYYEKIGEKVNNISDIIPFDIPENWCWARLGNIVEVNPRNNVNDNLDVSFIPMKNIMDGFKNSFIYENRKWKDIKNGFTHFQDNDVGFAKITPCFQNRKSAIFRNLKNKYGAGTTELHVLRSIKETILPEYLLLFVKSPYLIEYGKEKFSGTAGQQRFGTDEVKNTLFPLPPINEQVRITNLIRNSNTISKGETI